MPNNSFKIPSNRVFSSFIVGSLSYTSRHPYWFVIIMNSSMIWCLESFPIIFQIFLFISYFRRWSHVSFPLGVVSKSHSCKSICTHLFKLIEMVFMIWLIIMYCFNYFARFGMLDVLRPWGVLRSKSGLKNLTCITSISWAPLFFLFIGWVPQSKIAFQLMFCSQNFSSVVTQFTKYYLIIPFISRIISW